MGISTGYISRSLNNMINSIDWTQALLNLGIDVPVGNEEISILCPFHNDTTESCSINTDKGVWICFAGCGQGSLKNFIQQYMEWDFQQVNLYITDYKNTIKSNIFNIPSFTTEDLSLPEVSIPYKSGSVPRWIFDRGFNKTTMRKWNCSITPSNGLVIPIQDKDSRTVGWITRQEKMIPKYLYSKGLKKSYVLFGQSYIQPCDAVCITEGTLDTMWLDQLGFPSVSLLGMSMSNRQRDLLLTLPTKEIILCLDNDEAGQIGKQRAMKLLGNKIKVSYINIPKEYKDVQDIKSYDIINNIINNKKYW